MKNKMTLAALLFVSFNAQALEEIKLSIGTASMVNIFSKIKDSTEKDIGIKMVFVHPNGSSADQIFKDVDDGTAEGAGGGMDWNQWLELMKEKNYSIKSKLDDFKVQTIGIDKVRIATFKQGPAKLESKQIAGMLSGEIKNWKEVGGPDVPVKVILSERLPAVGKFLQGKIMDKKDFAKGATMLPKDKDNDEMLRTIGSTPGAIGFGPWASNKDLANFPEHEIYGRPVVYLFKGKPADKTLKLIKYLKENAPKYLN